MNYFDAVKTFQANKAENNKTYEAYGTFLKSLTSNNPLNNIDEDYSFFRKGKIITLLLGNDNFQKIAGTLEFTVDVASPDLTRQEIFDEKRRQRLFLDHLEYRLNNVYDKPSPSKRFILSDDKIETSTYCRYSIRRQVNPASSDHPFTPFATFTCKNEDPLRYRIPLYKALCDLGHALDLLEPLRPPSSRPGPNSGEPAP